MSARHSPPPASSSPPAPTRSPICARSRELIRRARDAGADLIMTPEASNFIESGKRRRDKARREADDPFLAGMRDLARETGAWILLGSLVIDPAGEPGVGGRGAARQPLVPDRRRRAAIVARYDKIHMFDIDLPGGESYRESNAYRPGGGTVVAETPWGRLGMTRLLRCALPASLPRAGAGRRRFPDRAVGVHGADRPGALACAAARAGDRERLLRLRAGAMGRARRRPQELRPLADRRSVGRGARRWRRGRRDHHRADRSRRGSPRRAAWCRRCSTTAASRRRNGRLVRSPPSSVEIYESRPAGPLIAAMRWITAGRGSVYLALLEGDDRQRRRRLRAIRRGAAGNPGCAAGRTARCRAAKVS